MTPRLLVPSVLLVLAGCGAVGPDYQPPERPVPAAWRDPGGPFAARTADLHAWWQRLGDPVLDQLVARAARSSLDRREALARVREARALRGGAAAERFPTLDASASYRRKGDSENTQFGGFVSDSDQYTAGFDLSWELDLWGRVQRGVEAADADLAATTAAAADVGVTVTAEVAAQYIQLRAFQRRLAIARANVALQEQTLALVRARLDSGLVGELDVAQAANNLAATRARVPQLEFGARAAENRLAVLLGEAPGSLAAELAEARPVPVPPADVAVGVPADLLRRRADVRRAERQLAAETARVGVAEGDLYPRLTLNGSLGLQSEALKDLPEGDSTFFGIGPSLRWNLFDGGRLRRRVDAQDARAEQALLRWERTVLVALEETENAMTGFVREQARRGHLLEAAEQARRAVDLAQAQYTSGLADFQAVLVSQRALVDAEDQLAESDAVVASRLVVLYKALGGGWDQESAAAEPRRPA